MRIAVVGAGIAGLACARGLVDAGHVVAVFEREDVVGGRIATLRTEVGGFDHGAQYLTARDPAFVDAVARWQASGVVAPWPVAARVLGGHADRPDAVRAGRGATERGVGVPGMAAIAAHLADGLDVRCATAVAGVERRPDGWVLRRRASQVADGAAGEDSSSTSAGREFDATDDRARDPDDRFDAVVVALPAPLAVPLLAAAPSLAARARTAAIAPCWALLLGFAEPVVPDATALGDAAFVQHGRLAWIARESSKPGRRVGERWTVHAQSGWSAEHFDDDPEDAKAKLVRAFHEATGSREQPVYATVHRWRHALVRTAVGVDCLWDASLGLGACGDWCRGHRIEDAWLSGVALARAVDGDR